MTRDAPHPVPLPPNLAPAAAPLIVRAQKTRKFKVGGRGANKNRAGVGAVSAVSDAARALRSERRGGQQADESAGADACERDQFRRNGAAEGGQDNATDERDQDRADEADDKDEVKRWRLRAGWRGFIN